MDAPKGSLLEEWGNRPWEMAGSVRHYEPEPHRAWLLIVIAVGSLVCDATMCVLVAPSLLGVSFGITACVMADRDIKKMDLGVIDPDGRWKTEIAFWLGFWGFLLAAPVAFFVAVELTVGP